MNYINKIINKFATRRQKTKFDSTNISEINTNFDTESCIVDDFKSAILHGTEIFSNSRTWYSFGGLTIHLKDNKLKASGNLKTWGGFGIDPGPDGNNGIPISLSGYSSITINAKVIASTIKLELYDEFYKKIELFINSSNSYQEFDLQLPQELNQDSIISKLQFVCAPGKVEIYLKSIALK